jgi:hypothetical protein
MVEDVDARPAYSDRNRTLEAENALPKVQSCDVDTGIVAHHIQSAKAPTLSDIVVT